MLNDTQTKLLALAFDTLLGQPQDGSIAFVRCFDLEIIRDLCLSSAFKLKQWQFFGVVDEADSQNCLITADIAVEIREDKRAAALLLVDVNAAGAGMDGIYNAGREISEKMLFGEANKEAQKNIPHGWKEITKAAVKKARRLGGHATISPFREFDYYSSCTSVDAISTSLTKLGLWPVAFKSKPDINDLDTSILLVERIFLQPRSSMTAESKVDALMLQEPTKQQVKALVEIARKSSERTVKESVDELADSPDLWVNSIHPFPSDTLVRIEVIRWQGKTGKPSAWSGLIFDEREGRLQFILDLEATGKNQSKLEIRWNGLPDTLAKGAVEYSVAVVSGDEELAEKTVTHTGKSPQKCLFTIDDFELDEGAKFEALVRIRAIGTDKEEVTDDFLLLFGEKPDTIKSSTGKAYRSIVEGAILIDQKEHFEAACKDDKNYGRDTKGYVTFRYQAEGSKTCSAKMYCPSLLRIIEEDWGSKNGAVGRWSVSVRADGTPVGSPEFIPLVLSVADSVTIASKKLAVFAMKPQGIVGMVHGFYEVETEYLNAWQNELKTATPELALQNTLEVKTLSGETIGLIVLPFHPLRLAWHYGYDQLAIWCRFEKSLKPKGILDILKTLDGAHFPAFMPGLNNGESFIFGDTLGFHAVAMVSDADKEPKASVALLAKVLAGGTDEIAPSIGKTTSDILATEISRYLLLHSEYKRVSLHALRAGDGMTIGRALGGSLEKLKDYHKQNSIEEADRELDEDFSQKTSFSLELFPSKKNQQSCGRFFLSIAEKKRSGAGSVSDDDRWMLESCHRAGDVTIPKLYWSKRESEQPESAAHLSVAFDTFDSRVIALSSDTLEPTPTEVFGLSINLVRSFRCDILPVWKTYLSPETEGKKHPASKAITDRIVKLHLSLMSLTADNLGTKKNWPVLQTTIDADRENNIATLHRLSDWVITIDRNAGVEYFDSPHEKTSVYDSYIIDCVPDREDLGFLQMVTSTSNFDEVRKLLDLTLTEMGLSASPRNCLFLLNELKALSGRFVMRLSGSGHRPQEMVALAMTHSVSRKNDGNDQQWLSLQEGFFVPIDDVPDLLGIESETSDDDKRRADLLYVTVPKKGAGFQFTFVEVKFRRYLKTARSNDVLDAISSQLRSSRDKWERLYGGETSAIEKVVRRSWLARILKFYAAKGRRHNLTSDSWQRITRELDKMVREGENYPFPESNDQESADRGYIFCPEYSADVTSKVSYSGQSDIYLFGGNEMPDQPNRTESIVGSSHTSNEIGQLSQDEKPVSKSTQPPDSKEDNSTSPSSESILPEDARSAKSPIEIGAGCESSVKTETPVLLGYEPTNQENVDWKISIETNPHLMIVGLPGMGKTTSLITICRQMLEHRIAPIIFSYHDDIDEKLEAIWGNEIQFVDYDGLGFNPLQVVSDSSMAYIDNVSMLRDIFASIFPDLGDIQLGRVREALKQSYVDKGWGDDGKGRSTLDLPEFKAFYEYLQSSIKNDKADKGLLTRLDELNDYGFFKTSVGLRSILDSNKPTIIRIHKTQNEVLQKAFATFVLHNLYQQMFIRGVQSRISHAIIFDEAHRAAKLKLIPTMAKECRKYGIAFVLASQEAKDFDASLFNAVANYLALRLNETDAKVMAKIMANTDHVNRFTDRIKQMPKYHAFFFGEGRNKAVLTQLKSE
jgi:DNA phosphorothioation-dependent restriction protein DptH